jgi:hypothetical protein
VLIWRLRVELKRGETFPHGIERSAARVGGLLLFALTAYVIAGSALSVVVSLSLMAQWWLGMWWLSGVSALVLVSLLFHEAREAWTGEACCADGCAD